MKDAEILKLAQKIKDFIGDLTHHRNCNSRDGEPCDCYARIRIEAADAVDELVEEIWRRNK